MFVNIFLFMNNIMFFFYTQKNLNSDVDSKTTDIKKFLPQTSPLDDEVFEETEIMTQRNDKKRRKNRLDFFCSRPSQ